MVVVAVIEAMTSPMVISTIISGANAIQTKPAIAKEISNWTTGVFNDLVSASFMPWARFFSTTTRNRSLRSEEHTSELQSRENLVCRLLLEKKKHNTEEQHS